MGLNEVCRAYCAICEYPKDHYCTRCTRLVCITKHCPGARCDCVPTEDRA
jgi:hypothetical protein